MGTVQTSLIFLPGALFLCLLLYILIKFLYKVWWTPIRVQQALRSQGIKGRSYRFLYGSTKEILNMRKESFSKPMNLTHHIFPRIHPHIHTWINAYGKNFMYWYGPRAHLVVTETELVKEIMNNRDKSYPKADTEGFRKKLLGDGLVTTEGEKWAKLRKLANHAFHAESLKNMTPAMISSAEMMLERWKQQEGKEIEVFEEFRLLTSEVISRTAFGSSYLEGQDIFDMFRKLSIIISRNAFKVRIPFLSWLLKSGDDIESEKLEQGIRDSIIRIIAKKEKSMNGEVGNFGVDFLGLLVKANHDADEGNHVTVQDVVDECKTFYIAGHETTTSLLAWTVLLLAIYTDWQEKARQEVLDLFGKEPPNSDGISRLKTMNMIINETLRLYPPVVSLLRKVKCETKLGNFNLPANINLVMPTLSIHHDIQIWGEDAQLFKPEKFSEGVAKATNNNPAVFLPFGLGPRSCVGLNFATNEAKIGLTMMLQRYAFTLSPAYIHSPIVILTVRPQHGIQSKNRDSAIILIEYFPFKKHLPDFALSSHPPKGRIFKNGDDVESDKLAKGIRDLILDIIQKREEKMTGKVDSYGSDFLGLLLKAHHDVPENYKITLEDIVDECKTFYGAGQGTTAVLLSWIVFLLALNTDWQDKVRQEVLKVLGKERPNSEGIARLKTMNMVVNETLRLYPPASNLTKKVQRKVKLGKLVLPANMNVYIPIMALHHDPKIWGNDAHLFNPERFSEGVNKATNNSPASYIPFSMGPRTCVGLNFAINEAKITLAMILQRYKFTLSPNHIHSPTQMLLVRPGRGVRITLHSLQHYVGMSFFYWNGPTAELVVTEPELIKEILYNRDKWYPKPEVETYFRKLVGDGLVASEGEKWAMLRKLSNHAFHGESLKVSAL
ncbi:hypothetical protein RJ640_008059 [Escallonia rubra]|uniref:Cytochrome P450 n=1 Tax=Escallonia rubra TaxID=112253 RepID=A0AA88RJU6_9ASTE|nr:hypothetical protein RJ640_008059 [Escallonia rubra]